MFAWSIDEREAKVNGRVPKIVLIAIKRSHDRSLGGLERSRGRNRRRPAGSGSQRRAIVVPRDWTVNAFVTPFMGAMEDKTDRSESDPSKRLTIKGFVMMGGVEVRN